MFGFGAYSESPFSSVGQNYKLDCAAGSYTLTGQSATFSYVRTITAVAGSYSIDGKNAGLLNDKILQGNAGDYALTGQDARLQNDQLINAEAGSYELTGNSATFLYDQTIYAGAFSFIMTGQAAGLIKDAVLDADSGAYSLTGEPAELVQNYVLNAIAGSYTLTGKDAFLEYQPIVTWGDKGGIDKKKRKSRLAEEKEQREELEAIVKREFDILDGTYQPEVVEKVKDVVIPQIKQIDLNEYNIAITQVTALLLQAKIQAAEYESELDDEEALLMLL